MFISLDGIDGSGKSTQVELLVRWLRSLGHDVVQCRDPGSTPLGEVLRTVLLKRTEISIDPIAEAMIYMSARAALVAEVIRPALAAGKIVVSDRYLLANVAYQGYGLELGSAMLHQLGAIATRGIRPDLTLVMDLDVDTARRRRGEGSGPTRGDRLEQRANVYFERVRAGFLHEAETDPERIRVVDANDSMEVVEGRVRALVEPLLKKIGGNA